jgi:hypothetical protein
LEDFDLQRVKLKEELAATCKTTALSLMSGPARITFQSSVLLAIGSQKNLNIERKF